METDGAMFKQKEQYSLVVKSRAERGTEQRSGMWGSQQGREAGGRTWGPPRGRAAARAESWGWTSVTTVHPGWALRTEALGTSELRRWSGGEAGEVTACKAVWHEARLVLDQEAPNRRTRGAQRGSWETLRAGFLLFKADFELPSEVTHHVTQVNFNHLL